jgi:hypothetical protein
MISKRLEEKEESVITINNPERLERVFAFGANSDPSGLTADLADDAVFNQYIENAGADMQNSLQHR